MSTTAEKTPKLTQKLFFLDAIALLNGNPTQFSTEDLIAFAETRVEKIDEQNAKNRSAERKPTEKELAKQEENARLREALVAIVREATEPLVRDAIAEAMGITPAKVSVLAKDALASGVLTKTKVKGEKGDRVAYTAGDAE